MSPTLDVVCRLFGVSLTGPFPVHIPLSRSKLTRIFNEAALFKGAEIGVWQGEFAASLCHLMPRLDLLCVDPWACYAEYQEQKNDQARLEEAYQQALQRLRPYRHVTIARKTSLEAAKDVPYQSLDWVYIDANHRRPFIDQDLVAWSRRVRPGGIVAGHDYREHYKKPKPFIEVKAAVDAYVARHDIRPWFILSGDKSPSFFWVQP